MSASVEPEEAGVVVLASSGGAVTLSDDPERVDDLVTRLQRAGVPVAVAR